MKSTAERVLDAAEDLFAEKGYDATSLGDVADEVGIRSPSLYNHFKNKEALYSAVVERLLVKFNGPLIEMIKGPISRESVYEWLETFVSLHHENPNFARLLQHAALSGGPQTNELIERMFMPLFQPREPEDVTEYLNLGNPGLQPYAIMALNNIVMSYITMAPMYRDMLNEDPFSEAAKALQMELVLKLAKIVVTGKNDS
jgi:TetR/AcrR family transcriptional regulator